MSVAPAGPRLTALASAVAGAALLALLVTSACNSDDTNPFAPPANTTPIPASAGLIFTSNAWSTGVGAPREVFSVRSDGSELTRLTACNLDSQTPCDTVAAAASPDRSKLAMVRIGVDANGDGRLAPPDDAALVVVDLLHGLEAPIVPAASRVADVDWSPTEELIVYTRLGSGPADLDLFSTLPSGKENFAVTEDPTVSDRTARIDPQGRFVLMERTPANGRSSIWGLIGGLVQITSGGAGGEALAGTPYVVGADASPDFSPDSGSAVFRRLTSTSPAGLGSWDLVTIDFATGTQRTIVSGPLFRGAPDWGPDGIAFTESENGQTRLVIVDPDGGNRRVPVTLATGQSLTSVRWLPAARN